MLDISFFQQPPVQRGQRRHHADVPRRCSARIFLLTQYLQSVLGFSTLKAGAVLLPHVGGDDGVRPALGACASQRFGNKAVVLGTGLIVVSIAAGPADPQLDVTTSHGADRRSSRWCWASGMANVMAPGTDSIMGSLPRAKAGVGSAVNDTTRQVGGAIGVAVIGSLLASVYRDDVRAGLTGSTPESTISAASSTVQSGVAVARDVGGETGARILEVTHDAFLSGYHLGVLVAAGITLAAAVGVFVWLPARATVPDDAVAPVGPDDDADVVAVEPAGDVEDVDDETPRPAVEGAVG